MTQLLLALDFGGTKHTVAVIARGERRWRAHRRVFSPPGADANHDLETVCRLAHNLRLTPVARAIRFATGKSRLVGR